MHLPALIQDLGIILAAAAIITLIFKQLKQPVVLGYILAGAVVSPHVTLFPTVQDHESIKIWAEIGVIFLLFGLGLEFSFKKLTQVGKQASVTAGTEVTIMLGLGYAVGKILGWSTLDSIFLAGIMSISSTTIIVRAFAELGLKGRSFVSLVFGVLVIEDLVAVLLLVILASTASTDSVSGSEIFASVLKLAFFLVLWFAIGIYALPTLLRFIRKHLTDETTLVIAIGLCFLMVIFATQVGFSPALGAFVMGSIMAETREGKRVEHLIEPVKNLFAAVFFVSVGMMIDPNVIANHFWTIILIASVVIGGKFFGNFVGSLLSGQSLKNATQTGLSLTQIGEFSFIIATLGLTLKVTSDFLYPIAVAVSSITAFTTPYAIKYSEGFFNFLEKNLPEKFLVNLQHYQRRVNRSTSRGIIRTLWETYGIKLVLNLVIVIAIGLLMSRMVYPRASVYIDDEVLCRLLIGVATIILASPFIVGMFSAGKFREAPTNRIGHIYRKIERRFISNLEDQTQHTGSASPLPELAPWDATLVQLALSPHSPFIAKTLHECMIREQFGVTVALIERGNKKIITPGRNDLLLPHDVLFLIGTDEQLARIQPVIQPPDDAIPMQGDIQNIGLESITLKENSPFVGKSIRNCGLREVVNGLIVGIERRGKRILNPDSTEILQLNDLLWVVGEKKKIRAVATGA